MITRRELFTPIAPEHSPRLRPQSPGAPPPAPRTAAGAAFRMSPCSRRTTSRCAFTTIS